MDYVEWLGVIVCILILSSGAWAGVIPLTDNMEDQNLLSNPRWYPFYGDLSDYTTSSTQKVSGTYSMKIDVPSSGYANVPIVNHSADGNYSGWVYQGDSESGFYVYLTDANSSTFAVGYDFYAGLRKNFCGGQTQVVPNFTRNWHQVIFNIDGNTVKSWVITDTGSVIYSATDTASCATGNTPKSIGAISTQGTAYYDDVNYGFTVTVGVTANFTSSINKDINKIVLKDTSTQDLTVISDWNWLVNGSKVSDTQDYNYSATALTDYNICLQVGDGNTPQNRDQKCSTVNTGDWTAPTISVIATQRTNRTDANIVFTCTDNNIGCNQLFYQVDSNGWQIASITSGNFQTIYGGVSGAHIIYFIASDLNDNNSVQQTLNYLLTPDNIAPTLEYSLTGGYGFTTDFNIGFSLTCYDNRLDDLNYKVFINDTNLVFNAMDSNATVNSSAIIVGLFQATTFKFQCVDTNGNTTTASASPVYPLLFRLINEDTGALYSVADINAFFKQIQVYSPDGNYVFDFNAPFANQAYFIGESNTLVFEIDYKDTAQTQITRTINFGLLDDTNVGVCVPLLQNFYLQQFLSNQNRNIILKNNIAHCYTMSSSMDFIYDTGYVQNVYTIAKPYYLYTTSLGVESVLALIDGSQAQRYNLDTLLLARQDLDYVRSPDMVAFAPLLNPSTNKYDLNILQIYYESAYGNNQSVNLSIDFQGLNLLTYDAATPNEFIVNWDWSDQNLSDQNWVTVTFTITSTDGTVYTLTYYVSPNGNYQRGAPINATWVAILSIMFFMAGLSIVSVDRFFGLFGALICLACLAMAAFAFPTWWTLMLTATYFIILLFIVVMGKPTRTQAGVY